MVLSQNDLQRSQEAAPLLLKKGSVLQPDMRLFPCAALQSKKKNDKILF